MYIGTNVLMYERSLVLKVRYTAGRPNAFAIPQTHIACACESKMMNVSDIQLKSRDYQATYQMVNDTCVAKRGCYALTLMTRKKNGEGT